MLISNEHLNILDLTFLIKNLIIFSRITILFIPMKPYGKEKK